MRHFIAPRGLRGQANLKGDKNMVNSVANDNVPLYHKIRVENLANLGGTLGSGGPERHSRKLDVRPPDERLVGKRVELEEGRCFRKLVEALELRNGVVQENGLQLGLILPEGIQSGSGHSCKRLVIGYQHRELDPLREVGFSEGDES